MQLRLTDRRSLTIPLTNSIRLSRPQPLKIRHAFPLWLISVLQSERIGSASLNPHTQRRTSTMFVLYALYRLATNCFHLHISHPTIPNRADKVLLYLIPRIT